MVDKPVQTAENGYSQPRSLQPVQPMERMFPSVYRSSIQTVCMLNFQETNLSILFAPYYFKKIEVNPRTATKFLSLLLSCVALGSDTTYRASTKSLKFSKR